MPHWRQAGATYFVTFRLADSLPQSKLQELKTLKEQWESNRRAESLSALSTPTLRTAESLSAPSSPKTKHDRDPLKSSERNRSENLEPKESGLKESDDPEMLAEKLSAPSTPTNRGAESLSAPSTPTNPRAEKLSALPSHSFDLISRKLMEQVERWLDQGYGACWLKRHDLAELAKNAMHYADGVQYELGCYVIMPNHIHAILKPLDPKTWPLERVLQYRKRAMSIEINKALGEKQFKWQDESFDRIIRDEEHLYRCIQYIGSNPKKAGISKDAWHRWVRPEWSAIGWGFEDG
jgi:REP element-mobilizing transposase RayT